MGSACRCTTFQAPSSESAGSNDPPDAEKEAADETKEQPTKKKQTKDEQPPVEKQAAQDQEPQSEPEPDGKKNNSSEQAPAKTPPPTVEEQLYAKIASVFLLQEKSVESMATYVKGKEFKPSQADGLKQVAIAHDPQTGCRYINVEFFEQEAEFMEFNMEQVYESVYKNKELSQTVCNVQVNAFQKLQDDYGQTFMTKVYVTSMNKATANKVGDWLMVEQPTIWTVHKMHPVVEAELAQNALEHAADCAEDEGLFDMQPLDCP
jgi:hypothetical protein